MSARLRVILAAIPLVIALPLRAELPSAPSAAPRLTELTLAIKAGDFKKMSAVLVVQDGKLIYEEYFNDGGRDVLHNSRSATKTITALAVGAALRDGPLKSIEQPAFPLLPDLGPFQHDGPLKQAITLHDFLTMSSAMDGDDWNDDSIGNEENMYPCERWSRWAVDLPVAANYTRDASGRGRFSYFTGGVVLLGQILQRVTGEPVDRYTERQVLKPLGITKCEWKYSPSGEAMTGGGLELRARDLASVGLLMVQRGSWEGRAVLPADWIDRMMTVERREVQPGQDYGLLTWRRDYGVAPRQTSGWAMSGNGGNHVVILPKWNAVVVVATTNYNTRGMHQQSWRVVDEFVAPVLAR